MMNAAAGIFLAARRKPRLPYDAEVEYLESTGTQWIDTGFIPTENTVLKLSGYYSYTTPVYLFGCHTTDYRTRVFAFSGNRASATAPGVFRAFVNGSPAMSGVLGNFENSIGTSPLRTLVMDASKCIINGVDYLYSELPHTPLGVTHTMYVFARNVSGTANFFSSMQLATLRIEENGVLVRDFQPVRFTNELGQSEGAMYDRVSGQLFRNSGTGVFGFGTDIAGGGING